MYPALKAIELMLTNEHDPYPVETALKYIRDVEKFILECDDDE